jgi:hypothetical protein
MPPRAAQRTVFPTNPTYESAYSSDPFDRLLQIGTALKASRSNFFHRAPKSAAAHTFVFVSRSQARPLWLYS